MPPTKKTTRRRPDAEPEAQPQPIDVNDKYAPTHWAAGGPGSLEDLTVPSGQLCLVRRPGIQGLMTAGVLHDIDSLSALVDQKHVKKNAKGQSGQLNMGSLLKDQKAIDGMLHTVDRVVCHCVLKPEIQMTPNDVTRRQTGVIYADMIDITDKMFIFQFVVGGTRDLESFRGQLNQSVAGLEAVPGVPATPE